MERIKVAVSPFFGGEDWTCDKTGIKFEKNERGLSVYSIPAHLDLTNIRKAIRLNALMLVEGHVDEYNEVKEVVVEAPVKEEVKVEAPAPVVEAPKEEAPVEEVAEEKAPVEEAPAEEADMSIQEAPKKATRKRAAAKK